jgi:hypothetical protein
MKTLLTILITAGICYAVWNRDALLRKPAAEANAPAAALEKLAKAFPRQTTASDGGAMGLSEVSFDVKKTDSLVNPFVGEIRFHNAIDYRMVFQWRSGKWEFTRLITDSGNDITDLPGGKELLGGAPMRAFLAKCGR